LRQAARSTTGSRQNAKSMPADIEDTIIEEKVSGSPAGI
jgi:hypothetical protein